jgi:3-(3-hydroxy-phenyl)propionate hydroxylase
VIYDAAVIGCGPVGSICAALLGSRGLRTLVIERAPAIYDKPRAFALDHEVMRILQNIGVADAVLPHTAPFTPSEYYGADGQLIKRLGSVPPPWPQGWPPNLVFNQPGLEAALRERLKAFPSVEVALGVELQDLVQDGPTVTLKVEGKTFHTRYVIGCDGASSTVRSLLSIDYEDLEFDQRWLVVDLLVNAQGAARLPAVSIQYCEPQRPCTYLIGPGNHRRWEISLMPGEDPRAMEDGAQVWRLLARWIGPGDATLWRRASYRFHALVAREWRRGRVFLAGDAAHQQPPFTGQGMCQGVRDAANLSWKLHRVLRDNADDALLDSYGAERGAHVRRLTETIKGIGQLIGERDPAAARARDARLLAEAQGEVRTVPRQNLIPPLECGYLSPSPHPANGTLFPQPRLKSGLMDDVTGSGFRVIARDAFIDLETEGVLKGWFERHDCIAALVRPDHYVYGVARNAAELKQLRAIVGP